MGKIIDGARFAPSAHNVQSAEFLVIQDKDVLNRIIELIISFLKGISHPDYDMVVNVVQNERDQILHNALFFLFSTQKRIIFQTLMQHLRFIMLLWL